MKRPAQLRDMRLEKTVERAGDSLMHAMGFVSYRFSQSRQTRQTPGIPDRLYLHEGRQLAVWWEAKRAGGKQRPEQKEFQRLVTAIGGWHYVLGTEDALIDWAITHRLAKRAGLTIRLAPGTSMLSIQ